MQQHKKPRSKSAVLYYITLFLLLTIFSVSAFFVIRYFLDSREQEVRYDELAALVDAAKEDSFVPTAYPKDTQPLSTADPEEAQESVPPTQPPILPEYAAIYELN